MKRFNFIGAILGIIFMVTILGCPPTDGPDPTRTPPPTPTPVPDFPDEEITSTYSGSGDEVFHITTVNGDVDLTHTLVLDESTADVYYVFTNTDPYTDHFNPIVDYKRDAVREYKAPPDEPEFIGIMGKPEITEYNADVREIIKKGRAMGEPLAPAGPLKDAVDDEVTFKIDSSTPTTLATCRAAITTGPKDLYIYVANNCWDDAGGTKSYLVNQTMVNEMAAKYYTGGAGSDIDEWLTTIFGQEWGYHEEQAYIPDYDEVTILLYDIDEDDATTGSLVLGFFWSKDNAYVSADSRSNERIMFYIDAVIYAKPEGGTWEIEDYMPSMQISTLAHEGQHMIHFYQKAIASGNGGLNSETWINEMCSLTAEDFLSNKMQVNGPRGVGWNTPGAGSSGNEYGRLPLFNYMNDIALTDWLYGSDVLYSYSTAYAYGAFIARNYGGSNLFQNIVQSSDRDYMAVENAISSDSFAESLQKWGAAILLSANLTPPAGYYQYNSGTWFTTTTGSIDYDLGSINLYNYTKYGQDGPYIYTTSPVGDAKHDVFNQASNRLYRVGLELTGDVTHTVKMEDGVKLTVVVKELL